MKNFIKLLEADLKENSYIFFQNEPIEKKELIIYLKELKIKFPSDFKKQLAVDQLTISDFSKLPNTYKVTDGVIYEKGNSAPIGGITLKSAFKRSRIFISPNASLDGDYNIFNISGHELVHAYHNSIGLSGISAASEASAYNWSFNTASSFGAIEQSLFYQGKLNSYLKIGGYKSIPKSYSSLPSWFPTKFLIK